MIETITPMYEHQKQAFDKLSRLKIGALYMEMGTGKTRTMLEISAHKMAKGKINHVIWLCPCSVKQNLARDIRKHANLTGYDITICGIESISGSSRIASAVLDIAMHSSSLLVVDESNLIKNPNAIRSKRIARIAEQCPYRYILNGTPLSRNEADMFQQWYILDWRILGYRSYYSFAANHLEYDEQYRGRIRRVLNVDYLTDKIAPYSVQISKSECLNLPPKVNYTASFNLTEEQYLHYDYIRSRLLDEANLHIDEMTSVWIYKTFTALQQVSSGRRVLLDENMHMQTEPFFPDPRNNPRVQELLNLLCTVADKCVIWCKFQHEVDDIVSVLPNALPFTGDTPQKKRQKYLTRFETDDNIQYLVANKNCAGYGLNLQYCHTAVYYNNDWDWATRAQSEDRLHRIGQVKQVDLYDIVASGTLEMRILNCLDRKENMVDAFKSQLGNKNYAHWLDGKERRGLVDIDWVGRETETA